MSLIVCGFPGVGKSTMFNNPNGFTVRDSDSSMFDKANFPENYIKHIKGLIEEKIDYIMVSSHEVVRNALLDNNIRFTLVYPDISLKKVYLQRYRNRGNLESFVSLLDKMWEEWIGQCEAIEDPRVRKICIKDENLFLVDYIVRKWE